MRSVSLLPAAGLPIALVVERGEVTYRPGFLDPDETEALAAELLATTRFHADVRLMYGRRVPVPRESAARGDRMPQPWTPLLEAVRDRLAAVLSERFDYVYVNRYRDGRDSVAWHGDRDGDANGCCTIASLSLGATRRFDLRPAPASGLPRRTIGLDLEDGDLLVMAGETQRWWEHRVAKDPRVREERLNLTFRQLRAVPPGR